jgi:hypothetical protein
MRLVDTKPFGCKLTIVTNEQGQEYVLQGYVVDGYFLIPFVPHYNSNSIEVDPLYWEPHYAKRETWIPINQVNFDEWDITKEEFELIKADGNKAYKEILAKYHESF